MGDCAIDVAQTKAPRTANVLLSAHIQKLGFLMTQPIYWRRSISLFFPSATMFQFALKEHMANETKIMKFPKYLNLSVFEELTQYFAIACMKIY